MRATAPALRSMLDAFARNDLPASLACFAHDATYREPKKEPIRGRDAIGEWFAAYDRSGVVWRFLVDDVISENDRACVVYRFLIAEGDGASWRERAGCATVRLNAQGEIAEWREYSG
jgi:ketosteroid isomerase-like protein